MKNNFESLAEKAKNFGAILNFEQNPQENLPTIESRLSAFEIQKDEILAIKKEDIETIEDKEFLDFTIKSMIKIGLTVLEATSNNIKANVKLMNGKDIEGFGKAFESVLLSVKELREFKKMVLDIKNFSNAALPVVPQQQNIQTIINIEASSTEMSEMIEKIRNQSQLRDVEAKFNIDTEKQY